MQAMEVALLGDASAVTLHLFEAKIGLFQKAAREAAAAAAAAAALSPRQLTRSRSIDPSVEPGRDEAVEVQVMLAIKEENAGKLDSHEWAFSGFAPQLNPKYIITVDVGTKPTPSATFRLLSTMERNSHVGGCCGEIAVDHPFEYALDPVVSAQHFEYKTSNILDKAMESCFGFVTVLPGAFSAYRFEAISGAPLAAYFKSLHTDTAALGPFQGNMYLAEDRILVFELLAKDSCRWTLEYVKDAVARTDVPVSLVTLIKQRRRWLNGSLFALLYALLNFKRFYACSRHSLSRKLWITVQLVYMWINLVLSLLVPASFYLVVYYVTEVSLEAEDKQLFPSATGFKLGPLMKFGNYFFMLLLLFQLIIGLGNKPAGMEGAYKACAFLFAMLMAITSVLIVGIAALGSSDSFLSDGLVFACFLGSSGALQFAAALVHFELHHLFATYIQYMLMLPTLSLMLPVYALSNLHDLSWGTKGADVDTNSAGTAEEFARFRTTVLSLWIAANGGCVVVAQYFDPTGIDVLRWLIYIVAAVNFFRFAGSILYLVRRAGWRVVAEI
jgi:chitin synthase